MTLPTSAGTSGYVLQTDGVGVLSWVNPSSVVAGSGTVNSSSIADGSIVDADINTSANIAQSKILNLTTDLAAKQPLITAGTTTPTQKLTVAGTIESTSGGIKFPDGTTQTTASIGGQMQRGRIGACTNNSTGISGSVTFATAFSSIPIISVTPIESDNSGCTSVRIIAHSTTGFTWNSYVGGTQQACDCINWTAIEP